MQQCTQPEDIKGANNAPSSGLIALSVWRKGVGVSKATVWRWRKQGWLQTVNIAGRQYLTAEAMRLFNQRAAAGEFSKERKTPVRC